jgi:hypothetical protein
MKFVNKFRKSPLQKQYSAIEKEWDRQRKAAEGFGRSHVDEIDAIFVRHLSELENSK